MSQLENLIISILGSAITMFIAYLWKFRLLFEKFKFHNQQSAEKDIIKDIKKSKKLRVLAMCGSTFSDKEKSTVAKTALEDVKLKQLYLISDESNPNIQVREEELPKEANDELKTKVINSKNDFDAAKAKNSSIEYRLHKEKVGFRLIILDDCLYLSQQEKGTFGKNSEMQRITSDLPAYKNFSDYFDKLWRDYEPKKEEEVKS